MHTSSCCCSATCAIMGRPPLNTWAGMHPAFKNRDEVVRKPGHHISHCSSMHASASPTCWLPMCYHCGADGLWTTIYGLPVTIGAGVVAYRHLS